jgi:hypothetical protein
LLLLQLLLLGNDVAENPGPETKVGEVSVFHWNCRSITHKLDHLQIISNDSSIICATESHVDENILISDIKLPGYHERQNLFWWRSLGFHCRLLARNETQ